MQASQNIVMPKLGLTMTEGLLSEWKVKPGDRIAAGDVICVVETEKIANEVEAPSAGEMIEILVPTGTTVPVGTAIARWTGAGTMALEGEAPAKAPAAELSERPAAPPASQKALGRIIATPLARRLSRQSSIDLAGISGSGPRGRIKAADVIAATNRGGGRALPPEANFEQADSVKLAVARRLTGAKRDIPHFYVATEAEVSSLLSLREQMNSGIEARISLTHIVICAVARALGDSPEVNRVWRETGFSNIATVDVGVAVQTDRGLMAPVLRNAGSMDLDEVTRASTALIGRSRSGQLTLDDLSGGSLTVSNVGMHDVTYLTPIVNPGQTAIIGVGSVRELFRPGVHGEPSLKRELGLVMAADHRVLDGVSAAKYLNRVVHYLENPALLLRKP
jgi:pyruvate dehydrogenase E2 component (dihydrolipoamide acetyltransferase)